MHRKGRGNTKTKNTQKMERRQKTEKKMNTSAHACACMMHACMHTHCSSNGKKHFFSCCGNQMLLDNPSKWRSVMDFECFWSKNFPNPYKLILHFCGIRARHPSLLSAICMTTDMHYSLIFFKHKNAWGSFKQAFELENTQTQCYSADKATPVMSMCQQSIETSPRI